MRICKWCGVELSQWRKFCHRTFCQRCDWAQNAPCSQWEDFGKQEIRIIAHK